MAKVEISNNVRRLCFENDEMTQQQLADRSGCPRQIESTVRVNSPGRSVELSITIK